MTKKPIISVVMDQELLNDVETYQHGNMIKSTSKALSQLIGIGLEKEKCVSDIEKRMGLVLKKLNAEGQEKLLDLADTMIKSKKYQ